MNKRIILSLMLTATIFAACSSDDDTTASKTDNSAIPIPVVVNISEEPLQDNTPSAARLATRTTATTTATLSKFYMEFYDGYSWNKFEWNKSGSGWNSNLAWPSSSQYYPLTFYAYRDNETETAARINGTKDAPYISISTHEDINNQRDVLVAASKEFTSDEKGSTVKLSFSHICSAVRFTISKTSGMADYDIKVSTIKLCNVVKTGDYYFNTGSWTLGTTKTDYTLNNSEITLSTEEQALTATDNYHFMIPQTLTPWDKTTPLANTYLELTCKISKGNELKIGGADAYGTAYLPVGGTWEQGKIHTINLQVGTALRNSEGTQITKL